MMDWSLIEDKLLSNLNELKELTDALERRSDPRNISDWDFDIERLENIVTRMRTTFQRFEGREHEK